MVTTSATIPRPLRAIVRVVGAPLGFVGGILDGFGEQLSFYGKAAGWSGKTLVRYKKEVFRLIAEVSLGSGALAVIGGTVGVILFMTFFTGTEVGLEGYQGDARAPPQRTNRHHRKARRARAHARPPSHGYPR